jgi:hypothetical protein
MTYKAVVFSSSQTRRTLYLLGTLDAWNILTAFVFFAVVVLLPRLQRNSQPMRLQGLEPFAQPADTPSPVPSPSTPPLSSPEPAPRQQVSQRPSRVKGIRSHPGRWRGASDSG